MNLGCQDNPVSIESSTNESVSFVEGGDAESQDLVGNEQEETTDAGQSEGQDGAPPTDGGLPSTDAIHSDAEPMGDAEPLSEYNGPRKKGIAIHQRTYDWSKKVAAVKPFWSYSWGLKKSRF